jgi:hypothetical protein
VFERFTERARQVVVLAQEEARGLRHNYIGTEHILLGLLREQEGLAARALESLGVTIEAARAEVVGVVGFGEEQAYGQIPFTPRAKKVLELALRESLALGHNHIGTEHILLALVREGEGVAVRVLHTFDADPEQVRNEVLRLLAGPRRSRIDVGPMAYARRPVPHPLQPPLDWRRAGIFWRPDRLLRALARELQGAGARVLDELLGVRIATPRRAPAIVTTQRHPAAVRCVPTAPPPPRMEPPAQRARGLLWRRATFLWRPEGLELRVPLNLDHGAMAAFANDPVWEAAPLSGLRHEIWEGWLGLASPTLLEDVDPDELRRSLDAAIARALESPGAAPARVGEFLRRVRGEDAGPDAPGE